MASGGGYNSPGAAGFDALQEFWMMQRAQKRQDLQDRLMMEKEARQAKSDDADHQIKMETLAAAREDRAAARNQTKETAADQNRVRAIKEVRDELASMSPGDFPSPQLKQKADALGISIPMSPSGQAIVPGGGATGASLPGAQQPPQIGDLTGGQAPQQGGVSSPLPGAQGPTALPIQGGYAGTPAQREASLDKQKVQAIIDDPNTLPGVREYLKMRIALPKGENPPAQLFEKPLVDPESKMRPVYRIGRNGKMEQIGEAPQGSHFNSEPAPSVTTGGDVLVQTPDGYKLRSQVASDLRGGGTVPLPLTSSTRTMQEGAMMLQPHIVRLEKSAEELDKRGQFGPVMSRIRALLTKAGTLDEFQAAAASDPELSTDRLVGQFATSLGLLATGAGRVHGGARGGGSPQMLSHFKSLLSDASSLQMFLGRLDSLDEYMGGYAAGPNTPTGKTDSTPTSNGGQRVRKFNPATGKLE